MTPNWLSSTGAALLAGALVLPAPARADDAGASSPPSAAAPASAAPTGVLTKNPHLLKFVPATRPAGFEMATGQVVLLLTIGLDGKVTEAVIQQGMGNALDGAALAASHLFEFSPAEVDGKPEAVQVVYRYDFTVEQAQVQVASNSAGGELSGMVVERGTRKPLPGIVVHLAEPIAIETYTDPEGRFDFKDLPPGPVRVQIDDSGYYKIDDKETVEQGKATDVKYYLEPATSDDVLVVVGHRVKKEVAKQTLTLSEIRKIPGASGDALKVVQNLPSVARAPFGSGQLIVRGSNPGDSGAVINRHFVPVAFHFGGLRSVFSSSLLESIDFYPGNFPAEYGRFQGGIVDVKVRRPQTDRIHGTVEADFFDAGFLVEGPVLENGAFALAGRRSYIDFLLPMFIPSDANIDFTVAPRYYDYQAIYDWKSGRNQLKVYFFGSDDSLRFLLDQPVDADPAVRGDFRNDTSFYRGYVDWTYRVTDDLTHDFSLSIGENNLFFSGLQKLYFKNDITVITGRDDIDFNLSKALKLRAGIDVESYIGHIKVRAPQPPKEGTDQGGTAALGSVALIEANRDFALVEPALWLELQSKPFEGLLVTPGARVDYSNRVNDVSIDPRLTARWALTDATTVKGGVGEYMQRPQPDESDKDFGNPDIKLEHSLQTTVGVEQKLPWDFTLDGSLFYKYGYEQVTLGTQQRQTSGASAQNGRQSGVDYKNQGKARIYGLDLLLRHELTGKFFGWISYTLSRSERKDAPGDTWRVFDYDQTHILTVLGQYILTPTWELGFRWRYVTGNPVSLFKGCVYDSDNDVCQGLKDGSTNDARLPSFMQLDLRAERKWRFDLWTLSGYLEIQNALNRSNPEGYTYNYDSTQKKLISGLPILPSLGLRGEF